MVQRTNGAKNMNTRILLMSALILVVAVAGAALAIIYLQPSQDPPEDIDEEVVRETTIDFTFEADILMNESGSVLIPITDWILPGTVEVESGDATLTWVDTEHGKALRIDYDGPVELRSRIREGQSSFHTHE